LWFSTSAWEEEKHLIAFADGNTGPAAWDARHGQKSNNLKLVKSSVYYIESLQTAARDVITFPPLGRGPVSNGQ